MKIVWLLHDAFPSGATKCVFEYIDILDKEDFEIILIIPRKGKIIKEIKKRQIKYYVIPFYHCVKSINKKHYPIAPKKNLRNLFAIYSICKILIKEKINLCITNTITVNILGIAAKLTKVPHLLYVHEFGKEDHGFTFNIGENLGYKFFNFLSEKIITNSEESKLKLEKYIQKEKINIITYPLSITNSYSAPKLNDKSFIILGQIAKSKAQLDIIKAVNSIKKDVKIKLNIVGSVVDQDYYDEILDFIRNNNLSEIVNIYNFMANPFEFLQKHHYLIMSSKMEAFGRVTVEAMLLGVPVIGRNTGGTKELIIDNFNGFKYDTTEQLEKLIKDVYLISDTEYVKLSNNSFDFSNQLTESKGIKSKIVSIFDTFKK